MGYESEKKRLHTGRKIGLCQTRFKIEKHKRQGHEGLVGHGRLVYVTHKKKVCCSGEWGL